MLKTRNSMRYLICLLFIVVFLHICSIESAILTPPYFNLVANKKVAATATCGEGVREPELYCKLTGSSASDRESLSYASLIQGQYCDTCDPSKPDKIHHANFSIDGTDKWWQSPPLSRSLDYNQVNLTIDFGQEFHVAYIYIKMANSPRPGVWALEKSTDYGSTFQPWQYFADTPSDCFNFFNTSANKRLFNDDDVICTTDYSKVLPVEGGEILVSLVNNRPNAKNFTHADLLQKWTRATNVRLRLMRTKNLLGHLMAVAKQDPSVTRRYFYSIRDISIGGRCVCNGHAQHCEASNPSSPDKLICRCSHNTCGDQCEMCCDGFVQKKWQPNRENQEFECEPCQCYGHSNNCTYDAEIDKQNLSIDIHGNYQGGGVCIDCLHNTQGINCQDCKPGYYRPYGVPITSVDACRKCECDNPYSTGNCAPLTGECECKSQYTGYKCQSCANGYTDWPTCRKCDCDINGRADTSCNLPCKCKFGFLGPYCDQCMERYFGFPNCRECECGIGALDYNCNKETGQCVCRPGYTGLECDKCADGYFGNKMCTLCNCDVGTIKEVCDKNSGSCFCAPNYTGERCNECASGFYNFPYCLPCNCDEEGSRGTNCTYFGNQPQCYCKEGRSGPRCDQCAPGYYKYPECIKCKCDESGTIGQSCDQITGKCNCKPNFSNDKCSECAPDLFNFPFCERCSCHPKGTADNFPGCNKELRMTTRIICPCKEYVTGRQCDKCKDRYYGLGTDPEKGCSQCECNRDGSLNELDLCDLNTGQCQCKLFVDEPSCNTCKSGFYNLQRDNLFGCQDCGCHPGSSIDNNCDRTTGQCVCLRNIVGLKCDQPEPGYFIPDLHQLKYEIEDGFSKNKQVRYSFDEDLFPKFSWKGYVHLNKVTGEVSQNITISKQGTYRMIVRYLNKNKNISELFIRVRSLQQDGDEQKATLFLLPNLEPSFETVAVDKINALILELEDAVYEFSFKSNIENLYIDYYVLIPSHYYESTILKEDVIEACQDYRNEKSCIQYKYPNIETFSPVRMYDSSNQNIDSDKMVDLEILKEFNHSSPKPLIAVKLNSQNNLQKTLDFPSPGNYILLVDFMNLNNHGEDINVEITHEGSNKKQYGKVFLYQCNITSLCREVILSNDFNEPLNIEGEESANVLIRTVGDEILVHQLTLVPRDKFETNYIKMAPYCIVKNKKCQPLEYSSFPSNKIKIETDPNSISPNGDGSDIEYTFKNKAVHLHNFLPEVVVPIESNRRDGEQILLVHYYQPNHPNVQITVFLDKSINGTFDAPYCPSISGCRSMVKFYPNSETFSEAELQSVRFQLAQNGQDIWLDYLLLASATDVNPEVFNFAPIDQTSEFISKCASHNFNIEFYTSNFCDKSVISLSVKYNDGAVACDCNPDGSVNSGICQYFGGQCECKENVIGRQCNHCKTGYFGFPNCKKCDCPTGNCDDMTGECVSPPNTEFNKCLDGYYGFHPIYGCEECNCDLNGTYSQNSICNKTTGQCPCKENTDGSRCDKCKAGFYRYPQCDECDCHTDGTSSQICDPETAQCLCKENIIGDRCDFCKPGTFYIENRNPKGCTKCFCFGQTDYCRMSDLFYFPEQNLRSDEWKLSYAKLNSQQSNINLNLAVVDDGEGLKLDLDVDDFSTLEAITDTVYWDAPANYIGNKVTSYGGVIKYKLRINAPDSAQSVIKPDLILVGGQNMSLFYKSSKQPTNDQLFENKIDLIESQFRHLQTESTVSREQLLIVLSSLSEVKLRATYYNKIHQSELNEFSFDVAVQYMSNASLEPALSTEQCYCPENFNGYSCESCQLGYYKVKGNGPGLFNCMRCNCSGHSDICDQDTGECLECRDNTQGKNCEACKPGHYMVDYGNGISECRLCPCPGPYDSNVFADSCMYDNNSEKVYHCSCMRGYYGQFCERCAPGYYGDPTVPGGKCLPCQCNNNIDTNSFDSCDQRTGACLKCLNNTAGINCEKCADWHYGDPIDLKNCKICECDHLGTETCDEKSGECKCKTNVIGYNCASCGENMWGFNQGMGCKECNCDPIGSVRQQCDTNNGKCQCKPGVGGDKCNRCLEDHWNFTESGCQKCKCEKSGVKVTNTGGFACNSTTGHCTCIEGVKGALCDRCDDRWVLVKHVGCKKCDTCVNTLLDDITELVIKADGIESGNKDSSLTFKAHNKLIKLENEFKLIKESTDSSQYDQTPLLNLQRSIITVQNDLLGLKLMTEYNINDKIKLLTKLFNEAELFNKDISDLRIKLDILDEIIDDLDREDVNNYKNITDEQLNIYENLVDQIVKKDFNTTLEKYNDLIRQFNEANQTVKNLLDNDIDHSNHIKLIKNRDSYIQNSLIELKSHIDKAKNLEKFRDRDVEFRAYFDNLEKVTNETNELRDNSAKTLKEIEEMIKKGQSKLEESNKDLSDLNSKVEDLQQLYSDHDSKYQELRQKCQQADLNSQSIYKQANDWKTKVLKSQEGLQAFEMVKNYEKIAEKINTAHQKSNKLLEQYSEAKENLEELSSKTQDLKTRNQNLAEQLNEELEKKVQAESDYVRLNSECNDFERRTKQINKSLEKIDEWINKTMKSDQTLTILKKELDNQQIDLMNSEQIADELIRKIQSLDTLKGSLSKPTDSSDNITPDGMQLIKSIEDSIENLKSSGPSINQTIKQLINENNLNSELEKISKDIYDLKILIESTRQIANDIKVAVNFNDSTILNLKSPAELHPSMHTSGSIYVKTRELFSPIAFIYNETNPNEYVSLYLQQGRPHFQYRLSSEDSEPSILSSDKPINDDLWHKIEIERTGKIAKLKVFSQNDYQEKTKESNQNSVVFNLDSNDAKFVLGQFPQAQLPNELKTITYSNQFKGAMDSFKFNGHSLGLWNYISAEKIKGQVNRNFKAPNEAENDLTDLEKGVFFMEDAFMCKNNTKIKFSGRNRPNLDITLRFKTESPNGLLWVWYNDERHYLAIFLQSGHINVAFSNSAENKLTLFDRIPSPTSYRLDDNKYHTIKVTVSRNPKASVISELKFVVVERIDQDNERLIHEVTHDTNNKYYTLSNGKLCIGGMQATDRENIFKDAQFDSFYGCYVSVTVAIVNVFENLNLNEKLHKSGIKSFNIAPDCPTSSDQCEIRKSNTPTHLQFSVKELTNLENNQETIGIGFITNHHNGLLFFRTLNDNENSLVLQLKEGRLVLTLYTLSGTSFSLKTSKFLKLNDNKLHHVYVLLKQTLIELRIDNKLEGSTNLEQNQDHVEIRSNTLFIAGVPVSNRPNIIKDEVENFEGCIIEVIYNNNLIDFSKSISRSVNSVRFSKCYKTPTKSNLINLPGYKEFQNTVTINRYSQTIRPNLLTGGDSLLNEECTLSKQYDTSQLRPVGLRFGLTKDSRLEIHDTFPIKISTFVSFKFRTLQPEGLMFYASDAQYNDFISLWLQDGYVNYAFDCGSGFMHIKSKKPYNDGRYHTITIKRDKQTGALTLSDRTNTTVLESIESKSNGEANSLSVVEPYYFGNIPISDKSELPAAQSDLINTDPFIGCMSDFNIAYKVLRQNLKKFDLMSCSNNHESGLFFPGISHTNYASLGGYVSLKDPFEISFEMKSRTKNGVILYLSSKDNDNDNYILLELVNGELIYKIVVDDQENTIKYTPDFSRNQLCNSSWIRVRIKKDFKDLITLELRGIEVSNNFAQDLTAHLSKLGSHSTIYIGSLPSKSLYNEISQTNELFVGCIRDIIIKRDNNFNSFANKVLLDMNLESGVLNYCPLK